MESVYEICFYGGLVLAILLLIASVVLFLVLKIPKVIGELTGKTAKKATKDRDTAAKTGVLAKKEQEKYYNMGTGKITVKEGVSAEKRKENRDDSTELLDKKHDLDNDKTDILRPGENDRDDDATDVLSNLGDDDATDVLTVGMEGDDGETDVLTAGMEGDDGETDVLTAGTEGDDGATDVLTADMEGDDEATDVLTSDMEGDDDATDVLTSDMEEDDGETEVLIAHRKEDDDGEEGTSILTTEPEELLSKKVQVIYNVVVIHTDEGL